MLSKKREEGKDKPGVISFFYIVFFFFFFFLPCGSDLGVFPFKDNESVEVDDQVTKTKPEAVEPS